MAYTPFQNKWWHPKRLLMCINEHLLMDGISVLGIILLKLFIILLRIFPFHQPKFYLYYVIYVLLIKHINNPFMSILSKVIRHLNLFTQICGVLLVILELMDHDITWFLLIIIQNMWFYPMVTKSGVSNIFPHFKNFVETRYKKLIKTLYSDNVGEFIALKPFLLLHGITYYTTAPYTS